MTVRLLPKSEIDKRKSEEQRTAIQEGLKVAERVDLLRETLASEETAFENYRTDTLKNIQKDIQNKQEEKDVLETEIIQLRKERKELLIPLDFKWNEISELEIKLKEKASALDIVEAELAEKSVTLMARQRDVEINEDKAEDLKRFAGTMFTQAEAQVSKAREESATMRNKAQAELSLVELQQIEVKKKENDLSFRETSLKDKENRIEKYERDLAKREATLRAGWKNLERTKLKLNL